MFSKLPTNSYRNKNPSNFIDTLNLGPYQKEALGNHSENKSSFCQNSNITTSDECFSIDSDFFEQSQSNDNSQVCCLQKQSPPLNCNNYSMIADNLLCGIYDSGNRLEFNSDNSDSNLRPQQMISFDAIEISNQRNWNQLAMNSAIGTNNFSGLPVESTSASPASTSSISNSTWNKSLSINSKNILATNSSSISNILESNESLNRPNKSNYSNFYPDSTIYSSNSAGYSDSQNNYNQSFFDYFPPNHLSQTQSHNFSSLHASNGYSSTLDSLSSLKSSLEAPLNEIYRANLSNTANFKDGSNNTSCKNKSEMICNEYNSFCSDSYPIVQSMTGGVSGNSSQNSFPQNSKNSHYNSTSNHHLFQRNHSGSGPVDILFGSLMQGNGNTSNNRWSAHNGANTGNNAQFSANNHAMTSAFSSTTGIINPFHQQPIGALINSGNSSNNINNLSNNQAINQIATPNNLNNNNNNPINNNVNVSSGNLFRPLLNSNNCSANNSGQQIQANQMGQIGSLCSINSNSSHLNTNNNLNNSGNLNGNNNSNNNNNISSISNASTNNNGTINGNNNTCQSMSSLTHNGGPSAGGGGVGTASQFALSSALINNSHALAMIGSSHLGMMNSDEKYSRKVFVGGLPPDIDEEEISNAFRRFGSLIVDWPHKAESKSFFPPKGYCFLLFQNEMSVEHLINSCIVDEGKYYWCVSSPTIKDKMVQIRHWNLSDSDYVMDDTQPLDPRKTIFVGGVPRPLRASELAVIMNQLYGGVCYAGIDTDPELKYPKGAGRVAFSNQQSYISAISARFVQLQHKDIDKRVEVKPYVLDDQLCDECRGLRCGGKFAPFFCANITCLQYYCESCWAQIHNRMGREYHKPLVKEGADRPRTIPFRW